MPPVATTLLDPRLVEQLKTLFGTGPNVLKRLGLYPHVTEIQMKKALAGYPLREELAALVVARWAEWRGMFLADPEDHPLAHERIARLEGDYRDAEVLRDPITGGLDGHGPLFTLASNAGKWL